MKKNIIILITLAVCITFSNAQTLDRSIQPKPAPANEIKIKDAQIFTLDNGLKVFVVEDHKLPQVYFSFQFDVDKKIYGEKAGVTDVFSSIAGTATTSKTKSELNKAFDLIGADFNFDNESGYVSGLSKYRSKMVELFADVLLNPVFTEEELDLTKTQIISSLAYIKSDASQMMQIVSQILMNGKNHPNGEMFTAEKVKRITIADVEEYYKTFIAPNKTRLVIVGDITLADAKNEVEKYFKNWEKREVPEYKYEQPVAPQKNRVAFVHKEGAAQSEINICYPIDYKFYNNDYFKASLMTHILGGGASGRLFQNLRETHSYTYGCYNNLVANDVIGYYSASASVRNDVTDSAIDQILFELQRIIDTAVSEKDLASAKAFAMGSFGRSLQQPGTVARFAVAIEKYNLPADYFKNYLKQLDALTVADIKEAAEKYIHPQNAWIIVVGDKKYADKLKPYATNGKIEFYDMYGNPTDETIDESDCTIYYLAGIVVVLLIIFILMKRSAAKRKKELDKHRS
ncbi:MAG: insulinase family protein [Prevotellaceae bacterium]|jgi:predicted Zn-dependent peptidase|nr:insulinase family protein [Prevotellaceae bacterium]